MQSTTIAALATAPQPAGIAVVRVSGPQTKTALKAIFISKKSPLDNPRELILGELIDYRTDQVIDQALAVFMPGPHSFTGEDVAEFQFHGSPLLVQKILRSLFAFGAMPAEPGEFTRRAFLNGKLDLLQAEAIAELINASSEQALKIAGEHLRGKFSDAVDTLGEPLRDALAELEASLDFPEEGITPAAQSELTGAIEKTASRIRVLLETYHYGHVVREGFRVLLCGRPNAGKSSLLNLLLGKPRAIVSDIAGTTRDFIEESVMLGGHRFVFCDCAGLTETSDTIEAIGVELAKERIPWADLVIFVVDATDTSNTWHEVLEYLRGKARLIWMVTNKVDLNPQALTTFFCDSAICAQNFYLSAKTGAGFEALTSALVDEVSSRLTTDTAESSNVVTSERQRNCLSRSADALQRAIQSLHEKQPLEVVSVDLREALTALEELVGKTYTEDILGRIFSKFCIGK